MTDNSPRLIVSGGRVYRHGGNTNQPEIADILIEDGKITAVGPDIAGTEAAAGAQQINAHDRLVLPGFVNSHYHSHDVLLKGAFETIPLELWVLNALPPSYPRRSKDELRARTLLGAYECLRSGITTVQDLATVYPFNEEDLEVILDAYAEIGIRVVFALQVADVAGVDSIPYWKECVPQEMRAALTGAVEPFKGRDLISVVREVTDTYRDRHEMISWALGPSSPERCTEPFLRNLAGLSESADLPVYTHIYESKAMTLIARQHFPQDNGSLINYLGRVGLLGPRLSLAHSVWMLPEEIETLGSTGTNVVLNPVGNMKTKSGVAPIRGYYDAGVNIALGCDNCSCSDAQNMFQAMKMFALLSAISDPEMGPPTAAQALEAATLSGARTAGMSGKVGALEVGHAADLSILDLADPSYIPFNSAARQTVFTESSRSVETVIVNGRVVLRDRSLTTVDERALREEIEGLIGNLQKDVAQVTARNNKMLKYLQEAHRRTWQDDVGLNRYVAEGRG
ncbi:MAG: amidohydrolase family protein [Azospirillaceae bacterium]